MSDKEWEEFFKGFRIGKQLTKIERKKLEKVLREFAHIFSKSDDDLGLCKTRLHVVKTGDATPIASRPYRVPIAQQPIMEDFLQKLLSAKIIRPSTSPWNAPCLLVKRPGGGFRLCVDLRKLNKIEETDAYPIPSLQDSLDQLAGATIFTKLDFRLGFYQIPLHEESQPKTAFSTHDGHYEFIPLPMGLNSAPAAFQRAANQIFRTAIGKYAGVYFDDVLVYSPDTGWHWEHLVVGFVMIKNFP